MILLIEKATADIVPKYRVVGSSIAYERLNFYRSHLLAMQKLLRYRASYNNCESSARFDFLDLVGFGAFRPHMEKAFYVLPIVKGKKIKDGKLHGYRLVEIDRKSVV